MLPSPIFILSLVLSALSVATPVLANNNSNVVAWSKRCGGQSPDDMRTRRVKEIFERVKSASDARDKQSRLFILRCDGWPWAATLQDRNVILTRGAIEAIYGSNDSLKAKDARLAFVLGHELKHVLEDDFWHEEIRRQEFMSGNTLLDYGERAKERRRHDERRADEDGFIYASLAGFDTSEIFSAVRGEDSFLADWAQQTSTLSGDTHFLPGERTKHLKKKFQSLNNAVDLFKYGVRLAHFGRYNEARVLLEDFQNIYPSAQVLNNLGYVYLQIARERMPPELAYRFWYPAVLDYDSGVPLSGSRNFGGAELSADVRGFLNAAVRSLESGAEKYNNTTATINLVSALMYLGEYSAAQAAIEKMDGWPDDPQLIALDAIAVMQNARLRDPWNTFSLEKFERVASGADATDDLIYNYARLLSEGGRKDQAVVQLTRLSNRLNQLPMDYRVMVCRQLKTTACSNLKREEDNATQWAMEITPGDDIDAAATRAKLKDWGKPVSDKLDGIDAKIYRHANGNSLLALNGIVEVMSFRQHGYDFRDHLTSENGAPQYEVQTLGDESVLSYGQHWSALVRSDEVREVWIAR